MSLQGRYQAARSALEAIAAFARETQQGAIAAMAELGLKASEDRDAKKREKDADRKRTARGRPPDVPPDGARKSYGHEGGEGGGVSPDPRKDGDPNPQVGDPGEGPTDIARTARAVRNASDDGAFGMTVQAWVEGIELGTGRGCTPPTQGMIRQLVAAQRKHRSADVEPVAWSRESATRYVHCNPGQDPSVFGYVRWLDGGQKDKRESGRFSRVPETPAAPYHTPRAKKIQQTPEEDEVDRLFLEERRKAAARGPAK